tara:strand:+ start:271 stop:1209 length:939 start_codon:yes stop_codon:yes gene_type:complete
MQKTNGKVAISCAITGAIHTPTMSDALPYAADDIAQQAIDAAAAGAAVLHLHARDPMDGSVSLDPEHFLGFIPTIRSHTDAVLNISTGGSLLTTIEDRIRPSEVISPEMSSLNMGSMNFSFHGLAKRYKSFKFDWEKEYIENSEAYIFRNTFKDIAQVERTLGREHSVKFEHECYDIGHLYNLKFCMDTGLFKAPVFIQFIFGILGGIGADLDNLMFMKRTADRLFGNNYQWSVMAAGAAQIPFATQAVMMGGNVRVGLEDSLFIERGKLATSNAEQVHKVRRLIEELGYEVATPDDVRKMLALKGPDKLAI